MGYIDSEADWIKGSVVLVVVPQGAVPERLIAQLARVQPALNHCEWSLKLTRRSNGLRVWIGTIRKESLIDMILLRLIVLEARSDELPTIAPNAAMVAIEPVPEERLIWDAAVTACLTAPPILSLFQGWGRPLTTHTVFVDPSMPTAVMELMVDRLGDLLLVAGTKRIHYPDRQAIPDWLEQSWLSL